MGNPVKNALFVLALVLLHVKPAWPCIGPSCPYLIRPNPMDGVQPLNTKVYVFVGIRSLERTPDVPTLLVVDQFGGVPAMTPLVRLAPEIPQGEEGTAVFEASFAVPPRPGRTYRAEATIGQCTTFVSEFQVGDQWQLPTTEPYGGIFTVEARLQDVGDGCLPQPHAQYAITGASGPYAAYVLKEDGVVIRHNQSPFFHVVHRTGMFDVRCFSVDALDGTGVLHSPGTTSCVSVAPDAGAPPPDAGTERPDAAGSEDGGPLDDAGGSAPAPTSEPPAQPQRFTCGASSSSAVPALFLALWLRRRRGPAEARL